MYMFQIRDFESGNPHLLYGGEEVPHILEVLVCGEGIAIRNYDSINRCFN